MKKICLFLTSLCVLYLPSFACTTFFINKDGQLVFGRNYDWVTETGVVHTNLRDQVKTSLPLGNGKTTSWISKWGSITFNQYGKEFPNGGMNEKGLVIELMWLDKSEYPKTDERPPFSVLQWIQYQLDNCSSVEEVLATDQSIRVVSNGAPQHYLVADANGNVATIEFLGGMMTVHKGTDLPYPVLSNSTYEESIKAIPKGASATKELKDNSLERFRTACSLVQQYQTVKTSKRAVDFAFDILGKVAQGDFTKWSIVYDITNKKIHFRTNRYAEEKIVDINAFDLSCNAKPLSFDMNQHLGGMVNDSFQTVSFEKNKQKLMQAFKESRSEVQIPVVLQEAMAVLASETKCK
jgi:penicillin V acylase-like amidase (Ntn superfamily)